MALSTIVKQTCKAEGCGKLAIELTSVQLGDTRLITLECGHLITESKLAVTDYGNIVSSDNQRLKEYQIEGVKFLEAANGRAILADEQGLGKTVQALALLKLHPELLPAVIFSPSTVKLQWHHEIVRWCGTKGYLTQVIGSGKEFAAPGFNIYIITYDLAKNDTIFRYVKDDIKTVIIDECQRIKNHLSDRAKAVQKVCKNVEYIIPMSGTPIKNNAGEYFTVLNLVKPMIFPQYNRFIEQECDSYNNGWGYKVGGLKNPDQFRKKTEAFILRRTKNEVLKDLPELSRRFYHVALEGKIKDAYLKELKALDDLMYSDEANSLQGGAAKIAIMSRMRHCTGLAKYQAATDYARDFIESTDRKLVIFTHHLDVMDLLAAECNDFTKVLKMHSGLDANDRFQLINKFREDESARLMVASTLASGEGINLQFCSDAIMLERQWNPANEEQAEARFHRFGQKNSVLIEYMICSETIDEYFTELVEQKRAIVAATLDNKLIEWDQNSLMSELAMILVTKGKKAFRI